MNVLDMMDDGSVCTLFLAHVGPRALGCVFLVDVATDLKSLTVKGNSVGPD